MKGKRLSIDGLSLFYARNDIGIFRVGISVSKRLGNAVKRNRLRRRIRDCIGTALRDQTAGYDLVFVARQELVAKDYEQICQAVDKALLKSALHKQKPERAQP